MKNLYLYHGHDWSWDDLLNARVARYDSDCVYLTDDPEYAKEFGKYLDLCLVTIDNPYILEDHGGFVFNDGKPFMTYDNEIAWIGDVCDYDIIINTLIHRGYDSVLEDNTSSYIVAVLNPAKIKIINKDIQK